MKKIIAVALTLGIASAVQAEEIPEMCQTMFEMMRANALDSGDQEAADLLSAERVQAQWDSLSDEEKQSYASDCEEMVEMMKQIKAAQ